MAVALLKKVNAAVRKYASALLPTMGDSFWSWHIQVTQKRQVLSRLIYFYELYRKIVDVQGVILEFGVQWGATLTTLSNLRGMLEPFNHARKIYGFDTFEGFVTIDDKDGGYSEAGMYSVSTGYEEVLADILELQQGLSPISQIKKFNLLNCCNADLDMDVYKPTKDVLELAVPRLTKGSLLVFDELNCEHFPGETQAVSEVLGLGRLALHAFPSSTTRLLGRLGKLESATVTSTGEVALRSRGHL